MHRLQQKNYLKEERRSVRKQKKELRNLKRSRKQAYLVSLFENFITAVKRNGTEENKQSSTKHTIQAFVFSIAVFILTFWTVYFLAQFISGFVASKFSIPVIIYSFKNHWTLFDYSPLYTRLNLIMIFGIGPLVSIITGLVCLRLVLQIKQTLSVADLILAWIAFHALNGFFGAFIAGVFTRTGFIYSTAWLLRSQPFDIKEIFFLILSVAMMIVLGFILMRRMMYIYYSLRLVRNFKSLAYLRTMIFFTWVCSVLLIILTNYPSYSIEFILLLSSSFLLILPVFLIKNLFFEQSQKEKEEKFRWKFVIVLASLFVITTLLIRLIIYPGVSFL